MDDVSKLNFGGFVFCAVLSVCECVSVKSTWLYVVCFECTKSVNDPPNLFCVYVCVFRGQCMEDVWKARLDSVDEKEKGSSVVCSGCSTTVLPAEWRLRLR